MQHLEILYLEGEAPVQAWGFVSGYPFYFHARGDRWRFAVGNLQSWSHQLAIDVALGRKHGFLLSRRLGPLGGLDASVMSYEMAETIIERCARAFLAFSKTL